MKRNCSKCNKELTYKSRNSYNRAVRNNSLCRSCTIDKKWEDKEYKEKKSKQSKELWKDANYREKTIKGNIESHNTKEYKEKKSKQSKELWKDPEFRHKVNNSLKSIRQDKEWWEKQQESNIKTWSNQELRQQQSEKSKKLWENEEFRENQIEKHNTEEYRERQSKQSKKFWEDEEYQKNQNNASIKLWQDLEYRTRHLKSVQNPEYREKQKDLWRNEEFRENQSKKIKERWEDPKYRDMMSEKSKKLWENEEFRENQIEKHNTEEYREKMAIIRANQPKVSSIQIILYSILDDLGIPYHREWNEKEDDLECKKGPWNFDCVIPRKGKTTLLIECQGNYWHSRKEAITRDKSKATYIEKYYPEYEIKYIWEHEFLNYNKVVELIKYWVGITELELIEYEFKDLVIKKPKAEEYKLLLSKYHYLSNAGRGGVVYGCYLEDDLISVVVFSSPVRQNINIGKKFLELSRFCVHPKYQKKNLGSWFISRAIKLLKEERPDIEAIISYCDTTFNHDGALYKSLNFIQDEISKADYWYVDNSGWVMHKKTLYGHAIKMKMKENEFAEKHNYKKVYGKEKLRFVYQI